MYPLLKKHRYDPELVNAIINDIDYYHIFFSGLCCDKKDKLYLPRPCKNGDIVMLCPLHKEETPSFRVNAQTNFFKCFGCGHGGNFITLLAKYHNVYYITAIKMALKIKDPKFSVVENPLQQKLLLVQPQKTYSDEELDLPF